MMFDDLKKEAGQYYQNGQYQLALEKYIACREINPQAKELHFNIGLCHLKLENYDAANEAFSDALKIDVNYVKAQFNKAKLCFLHEKYEEALNDFEQMLKSNPLSYNEKIEALKGIEKCQLQRLKNKQLNEDEKIAALKSIERCQLMLQPKIYYLMVDFKFTSEGEVVILEGGNGPMSGFSGYDQLHEKSIATLFTEQLKKINPNWNIHFAHEKIAKKSKESNFFKDNSSTTSSIDQFSSYENVIVDSEKLISQNIKNSLAVNAGPFSQMVCFDKKLTHDVIPPKFRPKCVVISSLSDCNDEILKLIDSFAGKEIIIKESLESNGKGVHIVEKNEKSIKEKIKELIEKQTKRHTKLTSYFVIEEIVHSKLMDGYDTTLRGVFVVTIEKEKTSFIPLGLYHKFPPKPFTNENTRESLISSYNNDHHKSAKVSEKVAKCIWPQIEEAIVAALPKILAKDLSVHEEVAKLLEASSPTPEGKMLLSTLNSYYSKTKQTELQKYYAKLYIQYFPKEDHGYAVMGKLYFSEGKHLEAIKEYELAIEQNPNSTLHYNTLAACYFKLGTEKQDKILTCLEKSLKIEPTEEAYMQLVTYYMLSQNMIEACKKAKEGHERFTDSPTMKRIYETQMNVLQHMSNVMNKKLQLLNNEISDAPESYRKLKF